jgi:hypothetical protein
MQRDTLNRVTCEIIDVRSKWLANPTDLHYRGELIELGARVTDAIEQELIQRTEPMKCSLKVT